MDPVEVKMFPAKVHRKVKNFLVKMAYSKVHIVMYMFFVGIPIYACMTLKKQNQTILRFNMSE